jgi:membrane-bound lytic murein transglycosylase D
VDNGSTFAWTAESAPAATVDSKSTVAPTENNAGAAGLLVAKAAVIMENSTEKDLDSTQNIQPVVAAVQVDSVAQNAEQMVVILPKSNEHVVQPKETLYGIAHTYNVGVMDLARWNNLNIQDGIKPGQVLKLSDGQTASNDLPVKEIEHEVKNTDTLYGIARKYGVTIKDLMEWNNKKDFNLAIGEKLKIQGR